MFTTATVGLLVGGVLAAPFGAMIVKRTKPKPMLIFVGSVLTLTSGYGALRSFL
jgi:uncharacterized membrane protein YfcA